MNIITNIIIGIVILVLLKVLFDAIYYKKNEKQVDLFYYIRLLEHKDKARELRKKTTDPHLLDVLDMVEREIDQGIIEYKNKYQTYNEGKEKMNK